MSALRLFLIILFCLNLLAFAAINGWLGNSQPRGEPERLTNQLRPESIVLIGDAQQPETAASPRPAQTPTTPTPAVAPRDTQIAAAPQAVEPPQPETPPAPTEPAAPAVPAEPPVPALPATPPAPQPQQCLALTRVEAPVAVEVMALVKSTAPSLQARQTQTDPPSNWWVHIPPAASRQAAEVRANELRRAGITDLFIVRDPGPTQHAISLGIFRTEASARQHLNDVRNRRASDAKITPRVPAMMRVEIRGAADQLAIATQRLAERWPTLTTSECR